MVSACSKVVRDRVRFFVSKDLRDIHRPLSEVCFFVSYMYICSSALHTHGSSTQESSPLHTYASSSIHTSGVHTHECLYGDKKLHMVLQILLSRLGQWDFRASVSRRRRFLLPALVGVNRPGGLLKAKESLARVFPFRRSLR